MNQNLRGVTHERRMEATVWSQPGLPSDIAERTVDARADSARLLYALEWQFAKFARANGIDYLDARTWLMDRRVAV